MESMRRSASAEANAKEYEAPRVPNATAVIDVPLQDFALATAVIDTPLEAFCIGLGGHRRAATGFLHWPRRS